MKTSELIAVLQQHLAAHGDLDVAATWEGQIITIHEATAVYVETLYDGRTILLIDAEYGMGPCAE